jgi:hypothetical protein
MLKKLAMVLSVRFTARLRAIPLFSFVLLFPGLRLNAREIYGPEEKAVVVKKLKGESTVAKDRFIKETKLLYGIKHSNIPAI